MFYSVLFLTACSTNPQPTEVVHPTNTLTFQAIPYAEQAKAEPKLWWKGKYLRADPITTENMEDWRYHMELETIYSHEDENEKIIQEKIPGYIKKGDKFSPEMVADYIQEYQDNYGDFKDDDGTYLHETAVEHEGVWYSVSYRHR